MPEEAWFVRSALEAMGALVVGLGGWVLNRHDKRLDKMEACQERSTDELEAHRLDAERYKLEAEQRFAKDVTVQATLSRLHERIDDISVDVKTILRNYEERRNG